MSDLWWKNGLIYCADTKTFMDTDGDGVGDLKGLAAGMDYLAALGVTCLWLLPVCRSPWRDDGYDVSDYLSVNPRLGDLGDFVAAARAARQNGIRLIVDLPLNHTSDEHPWFVASRSSRDSPYRDYYVWRDEPPEDAPEPIFPGEQDGTYTYDEGTGQYYLHRYHEFMPDLNTENPRVRQEMYKVLGFWLQLGVSGFRVDSVPFVIEKLVDDPEGDISHDYLRDLRSFVNRRSSEAILIGEANLPGPELGGYFGRPGAEEMHLLFDFMTCGAMWSAMALGRADPVIRQLGERPRPPSICQYLTFLRHHDEMSVEYHFTEEETAAVYEAFAPDQDDRAYGRGVRRRLSPMLGDDRGRHRLALSLLMAMPGSPMILYGDEYGLGDDLGLPVRLASRTTMQWNDREHGGFAPAGAREPIRPGVAGGRYGYRRRNVAGQLRDPDSELNWFRRLVATRKESPEIGAGRWRVLDTGDPAVLGLRYDFNHKLVIVHNLAAGERAAELGEELRSGCDEVFADRDYPPPDTGEGRAVLGPHGFRWLRLHRPDTGSTGAFQA